MSQSWPEVTLGDVCFQITDGAHNSPPSVPDGLPMASVKDMTPFGINTKSCRRITEEDFEKLVKQGCKPKIGDVLISKDGATAIDYVCQVRTEPDYVLLSSVAILRPRKDVLDSAFLKHYLDASTTKDYIKASFVSGAAIPRVVLKDFKKAIIHLPPLPTQRKIAAILSAYDDLIENNTRRVQVLEQMARALYREWFVEYRFSGHEQAEWVEDEAGRRPKGWEKVPLSHFGEFITGKTPSKTMPEYFGGEIPFIKIPDISGVFTIDTSEKLSETGSIAQKKKLVPANAILVSCIGTLGKVTITTEPSQFNQQINAVVPATEQLGFLYFLIESLKKDMEMIGIVGATMPNVSKGKLENVQVFDPGKLANDFSQRIQPLLDGILNLTQRNANLRRTRDLLLPRLVSGTLDVSGLRVLGPGLEGGTE